MTPTVDERLASIVRSLTEVILPHLPADASLAQEQVQLCIGHIQILRLQFDQIPAFERGELDDAVALARDLEEAVADGSDTAAALTAVQVAAAAADGSDVRDQRKTIHEAIDALVKAAAHDGLPEGRAALTRKILAHEQVRSLKDREWYAPYGFDTL